MYINNLSLIYFILQVGENPEWNLTSIPCGVVKQYVCHGILGHFFFLPCDFF